MKNLKNSNLLNTSNVSNKGDEKFWPKNRKMLHLSLVSIFNGNIPNQNSMPMYSIRGFPRLFNTTFIWPSWL